MKSFIMIVSAIFMSKVIRTNITADQSSDPSQVESIKPLKLAAKSRTEMKHAEWVSPKTEDDEFFECEDDDEFYECEDDDEFYECENDDEFFECENDE